MSIAFDRLGVIFALMTASAMALSVCMGVAGCLCPISSNIILMYTASLAIINSAASLASVADVITLSPFSLTKYSVFVVEAKGYFVIHNNQLGGPFGGNEIDKAKNRHIHNHQIHSLPKIKKFVNAFEEIVGGITVDSVWLLKNS